MANKDQLRIKLSLVFLVFIFFAKSQTPANDKNWDINNLRLNENFNGTALNTDLWQNGLGWDDMHNCSISNIEVSYSNSGTAVTVSTYDENGNAYNHGLVTGDKVAFKDIIGLAVTPDINTSTFTITSATSNTLTFNVLSISGTHAIGSGCIVQDNFFYHNIDNIIINYSGNIVTVTTLYPHGLSVGDKVVFADVQGLNSNPNINSTLFTISSATSTTCSFSVNSISGSYNLSNRGRIFKTDNVYLDGNSNLILRSDFDATRPHNKTIHTGAITSKNQDFFYGYYEIRCKLNSDGTRYMPAFWVWGQASYPILEGDPNWYYNENDFFEAFLDPASYNISSNVHHYTVDREQNNWGHIHSYIPSNIDFKNDYHIFSYEWTPDRIIYYLDGFPYYYLNSQYIANHPLLLTVDLGIKNPWTGAPRGLGTNPPNFENYMTIDYIRVYNLKSNCIDETITNFNSSTYNYSVKNKIVINGTSNVVVGDKAALRANDIQIKGDFTVPLGSELILLPTVCY